MIALAREVWFEWVIRQQYLTLYLIISFYFWFVWFIKFLYSSFYKPVDEPYQETISIVMPVYHEDRKILRRAIGLVLSQSANVVAEVVVVTDAREKDLKDWVRKRFRDERLIIVENPNPGKRFSLRLGIETATQPIVISVESDVFIRPDSIIELIKPFADSSVGGVIGDQEVHDPQRTVWTWFDYVAEKLKYSLTYPALGSRNLVTVLSGRTVAYRRKAVLPLLHNLTYERFLWRWCVSGDDGRLSTLLLANGWKTSYQSTSIIETVSPPTMQALFMQRKRWFRNTCRRTLRAFGGFGEGFWIYQKPLVLWHMLLSWMNTIMMIIMFVALTRSIVTGYFYWWGTETALAIVLRWSILLIGLPLTRFIRTLPGLKAVSFRDWRMLLFLVYPWYLLCLWVVRLTAIATMNKQGWVTRAQIGAGGFASAKANT